MSREPTPRRHNAIRELSQAILGARDPEIMRIVATVDAMTHRGHADLLIEPLRQRLATMRLPRPLRFGRLMFHPLDVVIVPARRWQRGQQAIPRTALQPMALHVSAALGAAGTAIKDEINGRTTADAELISRLGQSLWPAAANILAGPDIPATWATTELRDANYRPLANAVAALLADAATLDTLCAEAATGLMPPDPQVIEAILTRVVQVNRSVLPMMIAVLLEHLPEAGERLAAANTGPAAASVHAAMVEASDLLLGQLDQEDSVETRIGAGTLAEAGIAANRLAALLNHLDNATLKPHRRGRVHAIRRRLEAGCKARFTAGLKDELLAPLQHLGISPAPADIPTLEAAARGLRVLETEGRTVGGGATYDALLDQAADVIKDDTMLDRLSRADQTRLVEILRGPDAALAMIRTRQAADPGPTTRH